MYKFWIVVCILLIPIFVGFYKINSLNYTKYREIQSTIVEHPEKLPNSQTAEFSSFGFKNMMADMYWLNAIQYIGGNVVGGEYKKYLFTIMDLITDLNPYFERPYIIGQLLLPSSNESYETFDGDALIGIREGEKLGLKGIQNFCDAEKVALIKKQDNLEKIISEEKYANPCQGYKIPYYLAYIYYFYLKDTASASDYYKIVSAQKDAPDGARILAAVMQGRGGEREKSFFMFLSLANSVSTESDSCLLLTQELQNVYGFLTSSQIPISGELIQNIENISREVLPEFSGETEHTEYDSTKCSNYLSKAIRELNLMYLEQADKRYVTDNAPEVSAMTPERLLESGYIDFIPTDYQQYLDEEYGIIYKYDEEIGRFDYSMGY